MNASKKQRDELLDFICHLAEDDKEGVMATKASGSLTILFSIQDILVIQNACIDKALHLDVRDCKYVKKS